MRLFMGGSEGGRNSGFPTLPAAHPRLKCQAGIAGMQGFVWPFPTPGLLSRAARRGGPPRDALRNNMNPMASAVALAQPTSDELAGEATPLAHALGSPAGISQLADLAQLVDLTRPQSIDGVRQFLNRFRDRLLASVELPTIRDAFHHASRGEVRELIALDRQLAGRYGTSAFSEASRHVGRLQLRRLRPLRDRTAQRYLQAVEAGQATGWHVVVYGLLLGLFSLPLRQGLVHYASRTQLSLLDSALLGLSATPSDVACLRDDCLAPAAAVIQSILPAFQPALR